MEQTLSILSLIPTMLFVFCYVAGKETVYATLRDAGRMLRKLSKNH